MDDKAQPEVVEFREYFFAKHRFIFVQHEIKD